MMKKVILFTILNAFLFFSPPSKANSRFQNTDNIKTKMFADSRFSEFNRNIQNVSSNTAKKINMILPISYLILSHFH